ncbi:MAG: FAD/NAD(P)-binding protein [Methylovulum sp.]|nr:FAD/NAD(P)-binding protein [Methylovulum sp.]
MNTFQEYQIPAVNSHSIAVIGSGFSGTMVAVQLLRHAEIALTVYLIEANSRQFARGVAYSTDSDCHLLNVPAANMSAFPDDPGHFLRWARTREKNLLNAPWVTDFTGNTFLPRRAYGEYLFEVLDKAERAAAAGVHLDKKIDQVIGLSIDDQGITVTLLGGERLQVQKAVLAIGNFPPCDPVIDNPSFYQSPRYYSNPWKPGVLQALLKTKSCLLIGSGLTMIDWAVTLNHAGYRGTIHTVSRRGLLPQAHSPHAPAAFNIDPQAAPPSVRTWLHNIRDYIGVTGCDWRTVMDALRAHTPQLWANLPLSERRRFLRHVRIYWDSHRHRLAPAVAERLAELLASAQLFRHTARILDYKQTGQGVDVLVRRRGQSQVETLSVEAVVNCSGPESDYRKLGSPLVNDLLEQGLINPDPLTLGLEVKADGALVNSSGGVSTGLFTLGPPQKGSLWETIAVPEIREQAESLAKTLLSSLGRQLPQ